MAGTTARKIKEIAMLNHLPENFFSEALIQAHLQSEVGPGELRRRMGKMIEALRRTNPHLADSLNGAANAWPEPESKIGFLSGAFYILSLLEQKFSSEDLGRRLKE